MREIIIIFFAHSIVKTIIVSVLKPSACLLERFDSFETQMCSIYYIVASSFYSLSFPRFRALSEKVCEYVLKTIKIYYKNVQTITFYFENNVVCYTCIML